MIKKSFNKSGTTCKTTFSLPKEAVENAGRVALLGEFNDWDQSKPYLMAKQKDGSYAVTINLTTGRQYQFRYLIDENNWENDWAADDYVHVPDIGVYNSVVDLHVPVQLPAPKARAKTKAVKKNEAKMEGDDLTKIEGIGPKIASLLKEDGIVSFSALSKAKTGDLKKVLEEAGPRYKMHDPSTWAQQASLAAKGDWAKLTKLQDKLKGGKK